MKNNEIKKKCRFLYFFAFSALTPCPPVPYNGQTEYAERVFLLCLVFDKFQAVVWDLCSLKDLRSRERGTWAALFRVIFAVLREIVNIETLATRFKKYERMKILVKL